MGVSRGHEIAPPLASSLRTDTPGKWPLQDAFGSRDFNYLLFILVLVAFAIVVGPVNLFVFAKSGRRHRLFLTTPLISLGASALLVALILLQDGIGGRGTRVVLMEVRPDQNENTAYLWQEQFCRTGVLLGASFRLSEPAMLSPLPISASRWARVTDANDGGSCRYTLEPAGNALRAAGDWFQSRSEHGHALAAMIPTRGRIELAKAASPPAILSSFEFPLDRVVFADAAGKAWNAENVQPGQTTVCTPLSEADHAAFLRDQEALFAARNERNLDRVANRRDHFVAVSSRGPAVETFHSIRWKSTTTVVTGPLLHPLAEGSSR